MHTIQINQAYIAHPQGEVFVQSWQVEHSLLAPMILFHESLGSVEQWKDFPLKLARATGRTIIAYDRIGFGQSSGVTGQLKLDFIYNEAEQTLPYLIEYFKIENFIVFGHSIGGGFAAGCAIQYPQCQALIIESILARADETMRRGIRQAKIAFQNPKWMDRLKRYHGDKGQSVLDAWTVSWLSDAFEDWNIIKEMSKIHCPSMIIHPENDEYGDVTQAQTIIDALHAEAELHLIADCGHVPHHEQTDLIVDKVKTFLVDKR